MTLEENTVVADRFRLIRMIGQGGMGSVWHAFDTRLDIACAVKFIEGELANAAEAHARFQREARAAAALRSPHVVEIKDHGVWEGRPYIAMELLEGEDLGQALVRAGGKLPPAHVSAIVEQVCRALTKAHQTGIVHRDLKPDNIFLVTDDDRQLVKILDFGVAKQASQALDGSNTKTGAMLGTPYYMSPEQAQGIKTVDARSDLWSLAVIVYQCITGLLPFESEALGDLLVKIIVHPIPVPSQVAPVPPGFDAWWAKASDRNPDQRFQTAKELSASLAMALGVSSSGAVSGPNLHGTAVLPSAPGLPFHATPHPNGSFGPSQTAALSTSQTPHPGGHVGAMGSQGHRVPTGSGALSHPATFSGVEPPVALPRSGPSMALIVGAVAAVLLVLVGAGVVVARRASAGHPQPESPIETAATTEATAAPPSATPSALTSTEVPPTSGTVSAPVEKGDDTPPVASAASGAPVASAAPVASSTTPRGGSTPIVAKPPSTGSKSGSAAPTPKPTASAKKWDPGF